MHALTVKKITPHIFPDMGRVEEIRKREYPTKLFFYIKPATCSAVQRYLLSATEVFQIGLTCCLSLSNVFSLYVPIL